MTAPPPPPPPDPEAWNLARKRVQAKRNLGRHAVTYVVVNSFLVFLWFMGDRDSFWPAWVLAGWGIGLALNAYDVLVRRPVTSADIEREMRRGRPPV